MTQRVHISLKAPGMKSLVITQWVLISLTIGCVSLSVGLWWYGRDLDTQTTDFQMRIAELEQTNQQMMVKANSQGFDLSDRRRQELPKEVSFAKEIRTHQSFSWTQFLNDLEATVPEKISMDSVTLNFKDSSIALQGSAATLNDLNMFVDGLENHRAFHHVVVSRHSHKSKKKDKKHKYVIFTMKVSYEPIRT